MNSPEEYLIVNDVSKPLIVDGPYYSALKKVMLAKFASQPNPEERLKKLEENAQQIFLKIQTLKNNSGGRNLLLVGKVQSGKTSNMQMALALAFDNGYDCLVMYGGYDNTLLEQAITRFSDEAFKKPDNMSDQDARYKWASIFTTDPKGTPHPLQALDEENFETIKANGGKVIIICRKGPDAINKVNDLFNSWNSRDQINALVFDDEGDQASLNNEFRKNGSSPTYSAISNMKKALNNPPYLSVTATPQALVFSPDTSRLKPKLLQLIEPGKGYTGLDEFHLGDEKAVIVDDEIDSCITKDTPDLPQSLWTAVRVYLLSSALLKHENILNQAQMIVHFDKLTKKHQIVYELISEYLEQYKKAIRNKQSSFVDSKLSREFKPIFEDQSLITHAMKRDNSFDDIKEDLKQILKKVYVALMNRPGKDTMAGLEWKQYQIRVGADLLQRGVSFDQLITTYFTRWPKGTSNMDTQIQRARWLGYRSKYFDYCKVFTTKEIEYRFSILASIEDDLWDQMREVQEGTKKLDDIMVEADPKMRPSRRSAADYHMQTFGRKWLNQSIGTTSFVTTSNNNKALIELVNKYTFEPTTAGSTQLEPSKITAFHAHIHFADFERFIKSTHDIFDNYPFRSETILKIASNKPIDLILFWDPKKSNLDQMSFGKDIRERRFADVENGCRVSALQQGADKVDENERKYKGDAYVISDKSALTIQVFPIEPKKDVSPKVIEGQTQFMYSIHTPKAIAVYMRGGSEQ